MNTARFNSNKPKTEGESEKKPTVRNKSLLWRQNEKRKKALPNNVDSLKAFNSARSFNDDL